MTVTGVMEAEVAGAGTRITRTCGLSTTLTSIKDLHLSSNVKASTGLLHRRQEMLLLQHRTTVRVDSQRSRLHLPVTSMRFHRKRTDMVESTRVCTLRATSTRARAAVVKPDYRRAPTPTCKRVARWEMARQKTRNRTLACRGLKHQSRRKLMYPRLKKSQHDRRQNQAAVHSYCGGMWRARTAAPSGLLREKLFL